MFVVILVYFSFVFIRGELQQVKLPDYMPPSPEEIRNTYFHNWHENSVNRTKKSVLNISEKYYKTLATMKKELSANITSLESNSNFTGEKSVSRNKENFIGMELLKNILMASIEPTTYRYSTAVWSFQPTTFKYPTAVWSSQATTSRYPTAVWSSQATTSKHPTAVWSSQATTSKYPTAVWSSQATTSKYPTAVWSSQPTTYKYPTAIWSSHTYEKLKTNQKFKPRNLTKPDFIRTTLNPLYVYLGQDNALNSFGNTQKRNRGRIKWINEIKTSKIDHENNSKKNESDFADKFLEQSLEKYLMSSNLKQSVGNVSVKTFSEILKNITDMKPKKLQSPYDENKELRMRFREEVILKKKNETKPQEKFLQKQLQKRLEKVQDVFGEVNKEKILTNMWKYMTLNRSMEVSEKLKNNISDDTFNVTTTQKPETNFPRTSQNYNASLIYITTDKPKEEISQGAITNISDYYIKETTTTNYTKSRSRSRFEGFDDSEKKEKNLLKLTAEESSYYNKRQFPSLTFIGKQEKPGIIPGTPQIDYPIHSFPPATRFKCPKFKDGKPRMMADKATRCQVFYICTGDGPTTAMLCPNGTMFNENFLVCDWWYNVHC